MTEISFNVGGRAQMDVIFKIIDRATAMARSVGQTLDRASLAMDIAATHANGCPLRLGDLLLADDFNFAHDVFGIERHIDRETGKLGNCFLPRFPRKDRPRLVARAGL